MKKYKKTYRFGVKALRNGTLVKPLEIHAFLSTSDGLIDKNK
ncbi:hypothetical protein [Lacticigenium naphthae]|nr:hypothetical protein [Lacticigenium naphthae]